MWRLRFNSSKPTAWPGGSSGRVPLGCPLGGEELVVIVSVSVVVPTYNRAHLLPATLDSLQHQTMMPTEVIVVDDGSTDATAAVVRRFPGVTYLRQENGGKSSALNFALGRISTDYLWVFDDDDVAALDAVERLVKALEQNPECAYAYGTFVSHRSEGLELGPEVTESWIPPLAATAPFVALLEGCYLSGATLMARTECYRAVGGYDVRFRRSQDYHMALALAGRWRGVRVEGGPIYHYRRHSGIRGGPRHEVAVSDVGRNHHEHDAVIFRELYRDLPLQSYLPSDRPVETHQRQAIMQRMSVLTIHRVYPEALVELSALAACEDEGPYSPDERAVLERMVELTNGLATGDQQFARALNELAAAPPIQQLRNSLIAILTRRMISGWRSPSSTARLAWRTSWLLPGGLRVADLKKRIHR